MDRKNSIFLMMLVVTFSFIVGGLVISIKHFDTKSAGIIKSALGETVMITPTYMPTPIISGTGSYYPVTPTNYPTYPVANTPTSASQTYYPTTVYVTPTTGYSVNSVGGQGQYPTTSPYITIKPTEKYPYPTINPTTGSYTNTYPTYITVSVIATITPVKYYTDRFYQADQTTILCIAAHLTPEEQNKLRYTTPSTPEDEIVMQQLREKIYQCFSGSSQTTLTSTPPNKTTQFSEETKQCLIKTVGASAFEEISTGKRAPTQPEKILAEKCLATEPAPKIDYQKNGTPIDSAVENCVTLAVGNAKYAQIANGTALPTLEDRQNIERCFGSSPNPLKTNPAYVIPPEVDTCLQQSISTARYGQIKAHQSEPTEEERMKAKTCFDRLQPVQARLLPAPAEQVPFFKQEPESIKINQAVNKTENISSNVKDKVIVLQGKGIPNSVVDLYIFSDPIVVETKTDENGDWVYKFNEPLQSGSHIAYAAVKTTNGDTVRSAVFNFNVAVAAAAESNQPLLEENKASSVPSQFMNWAIILIVVSMILVGIVGVFVYMRYLRPKGYIPQQSDTQDMHLSSTLTDGKSESEETSTAIH